MIHSYTPPPFELEVSDRVIGKTIVKQKVRFLRLEHNDAARTCTIHILVMPYAVAEDGGYGPALTRSPFVSYPDTLNADNTCIIDTQTGAFLAQRYARKADGTLGTDAEWQAEVDRIMADDTIQAMYQGDYFLQLRDTQPLIIGDLIRLHIQRADASPSRFA